MGTACAAAGWAMAGIVAAALNSPAALALTPHALAPVAELPVLEVVLAVHIVADLTLGLGEVVHDYLSPRVTQSIRSTEKSYAL